MIIGITCILALGTLCQWVAWKSGLPSILVLLATGFILGPGTGLLDVESLFGPWLLSLASLAVAIILFEGGLTLKLSHLGDVGGAVRGLIVVGSLVTFTLVSLAAGLVAGTSLQVALVCGGLLIVTGPTVIVPLLNQIRLRDRVADVLRWEGIINDPLGAVLAVLLLEGLIAHNGVVGQYAVAGMLIALLVGATIAALMAGALILAFSHHQIPDHLHSPAILSAVAVSYLASNAIQEESGLLTATLLGIFLANQNTLKLDRILEFHENLRVISIAALFLVLTARIPRSLLETIGAADLLFVALVIFIIRPLAVLLGCLRGSLEWKEKLYLSLVAPRGIVAAAVASLFTVKLSEAGVQDADRLLALAFLTVVGTVIFSGLLAGPAARLLGFAHPNPQGVLFVGADAPVRGLASVLRDEGFQVTLVDSSRPNCRRASSEGLQCVNGDALSPRTESELDLFGIGKVFAMTPSDEVNSLSVLHHLPQFGQAEVYQLPSEADPELDSSDVHLRGRTLFGPDFTYQELTRRWAEGQRFEAVEQADWEEENDLECVVVGADGKLRVYTSDATPAPQDQDRLVVLR